MAFLGCLEVSLELYILLHLQLARSSLIIAQGIFYKPVIVGILVLFFSHLDTKALGHASCPSKILLLKPLLSGNKIKLLFEQKHSKEGAEREIEYSAHLLCELRD